MTTTRARKPKPKRPGRPPSDNPADVVVRLRVTGDTRDRWQAAAARAGQTLSDYVRAAVEASVGIVGERKQR